MSFVTVVQKVGKKVVNVITYPFRHSLALAKLLKDVQKDTPATVAALVKLVKLFESMGPEIAAAIAARGFDIPDDLKAAADIKALFLCFTDDVLPAIEIECTDLKADLLAAGMVASADEVPGPVDTAQVDASPLPDESIPQSGPGLHNVVPA